MSAPHPPLSGDFPFHRGLPDITSENDPTFAPVQSSLIGELGKVGERWDFEVIEQVEGFQHIRVGLRSEADRETFDSLRHLGWP